MPQIVPLAEFAGAVVLATKGLQLVGTVIGGIFGGNRNKASKVSSQVTSANTQDKGQSLTIKTDAARRLVYGKTRLSGVLVYENVSGDGHEYLWQVIVLAAHKISGVSQIYFDGEAGPSKYSGYYDYWIHDGTQTEADAQLMATFKEWTNACKLLGCAYAVVRLKYDKSVWTSGEPNPTFDIVGKPVLDPRKGITAYSSNAALIINDFLKSSDGMNATDDEVNTESIKVAADICDQIPSQMSASLCTGRYTIDGMIELSTKSGDTLNDMLAACAGTIVWEEGQFKLYVGASRPAVSRELTSNDLRGSPSIQPRTPSDESFNGVKGTFIDASNNYASTDFPPVIGQVYVDQDGGVVQTEDVQFKLVTSSITAQRLANIILRRARLETTINMPCNWKVWNYEVWDVVKLNLPEFGWVSKLFQITDWKVTPATASDSGGIDLTLVEYSDDIYSDDMNLKPIAGGGTIVVPDITVPKELPTLTATSNSATVDSSGNPRVRFDWNKSADIYCVGYQIAYGKSPFNPKDSDYYTVVGADNVSVTTGNLNAGDIYEGYIKVINSFNKTSKTTRSNTVVVRGSASAYPPAVAGLTVNNSGDYADLQWLAPTTNNVNSALIYWSKNGTVEGGSLIATVNYPQNSIRVLRELQDGYYSVAFMSNGGLIGEPTTVKADKRDAAKALFSVGFSKSEGKLDGAIWYNDTTAVSKSSNLAKDQGWETFDKMVPNPISRVQYWSNRAYYVSGGTVKVTGALAWLKAPNLPNIPPIVNAFAQLHYYDRTVTQQGDIALSSDANINLGFDVNITDDTGNVFYGFNGTLEKTS